MTNISQIFVKENLEMHGYESTRIRNSRPCLKRYYQFIKTLENYVVSIEQKSYILSSGGTSGIAGLYTKCIQGS